MKSESVSCSVVSDSLWSHGLQAARLLWPWNSLGKNTGVGCHFLFQGIFPTQGSNLGLLHCRRILKGLSHQGSVFFKLEKYQIPRIFLHCKDLKYLSGFLWDNICAHFSQNISLGANQTIGHFLGQYAFLYKKRQLNIVKRVLESRDFESSLASLLSNSMTSHKSLSLT